MSDIPRQVQEHIAHTPEEEIRELEERLEQKKRQLAEQDTVPRQEKELFREVLREHIEDAGSQPLPVLPHAGITHVPTKTGVSAVVTPIDPKEREEALRTLVEVALSKSLKEAIKIAQENSPYLLDELHDHLVDEYYEKLVQLKKIHAT